MKLNRIVFLSAVTLIGTIGQALAGTIDSGTLNYSFTGFTSDTSCAGAQQRENFTGTVTDTYESLSSASLSFSICNIPGSYAGGKFTLTLDANDVVSGVISATDLGDVITSGIDTATVAGTFTVTAGTGAFAGGVGKGAAFSAQTQENTNTGAGSGTFIITPEPATTVLMGLGVLALGLANARRRGARLTLRA